MDAPLLCAWCQKEIKVPGLTKTRKDEHGRWEYYHHHFGKDCLKEKAAALSNIKDRKLEEYD